MKQDFVREVENLYALTLNFLEEEGITEKPPAHGPSRTEYLNTFQTLPEKYLLQDNLLLLLKDV